MKPSRYLALMVCAAGLFASAPPKPKLIVHIAIDQFRYDYLPRFRADYTGGLKRLLENGAVFANAHYEHFPTVTAIGHSAMLTGATPSLSGIVGNEWFDRESGKQVTSVSDDSAKLLGGEGRASSPRRLLVSTVGDELKMANHSQSKVIGVSSKDRAAILPAGRMANGAFWFNTENGNFVSSTFYFDALPDWVEKFNAGRAADQWTGKNWSSFDSKSAKPFATLGAKPDRGYFNTLDRTPYSNELLVLFAEAAVEGEHLGADDVTDVLTISFSANDRVGHSLGPDAAEMRDISIQSDRTLGRLFEFLDQKVGRDNYMVTFTGDHGVAPMPEVMQERKMPGGRMPEGVVLNAIQSALSSKYGAGDWVAGKSGPAPYLNYSLIEEKKLSHEEVEETAAEAVRAIPHIYRVYTRTQLRKGQLNDDIIDRRVRAGFHDERGSDLFIVSQPYWLFEARGTSHGTPYNYDSHVPIIFMGRGIKAGRYFEKVAVNDIAPTLTSIVDVETPSGSSGRVLYEMFE